jgi:hypothetical protein
MVMNHHQLMNQDQHQQQLLNWKSMLHSSSIQAQASAAA